jgi:hypothetical protein
MMVRKIFLLIFISFFADLGAQQIYPYYNHKTQYEFGLSNETYLEQELKQGNRRVYSDNYLLSPGLHYHLFRKVLINNPRYSHRGMHFLLAGAGFKLSYLPVTKDLYVDRILDAGAQNYKDTIFLFTNRTMRLSPSFFIDHTKDIGGAYRLRIGIGMEYHVLDVQQNVVEINKATKSNEWTVKPYSFAWPGFNSESINMKLRFTIDKALDYDHYMGFGIQVLYGKNREVVQGVNILRPIKLMLEWHYGIFGK